MGTAACHPVKAYHFPHRARAPTAGDRTSAPPPGLRNASTLYIPRRALFQAV